jgi:hypothetical protein
MENVSMTRVMVCGLLAWLALAAIVASVVVAAFAFEGDAGGHVTIDWNPIILSFVASIPATVAAIGAFWVSVMNSRRVATVAVTVGEVKEEVHKVEVATNSMKDQLVAATKSASLAEGRDLGVAEEQARRGAKDLVKAGEAAARREGHTAGGAEEKAEEKARQSGRKPPEGDKT